jgi:hypothetical protein
VCGVERGRDHNEIITSKKKTAPRLCDTLNGSYRTIGDQSVVALRFHELLLSFTVAGSGGRDVNVRQ